MRTDADATRTPRPMPWSWLTTNTVKPPTLLRPLARSIRVLAAAIAALCFALPAWAGTLQVRDTAAVLTPDALSAVRSEVNALPFDVRVVTSNEHADSASFDHYVHQQMAEANMVVIGVDPSHHRTSVHVGTRTGIAPGTVDAIKASAVPHFKAGHFGEGVTAVATTMGCVAAAANA